MSKKKYFIILAIFVFICGALILTYALVPHEEAPKVIEYGEEYLKYSKIFNLELSENEDYYVIKKLIQTSDEVDIPNTIDNIPVKKWYLDNKNGISFKNVRVIKIPAAMEFIGSEQATEFSFISADGNELVAYVVDENNQYFASVDGVLYSKDLKTLYKYPNQKSGESSTVIINDYVETIYKNSFCSNTSIRSLKLGKNVITIQNDAFRDCSSLTMITFNEKLEEICEFAFYQCNLTNVEFPNSVKQILTNSFCGNSSLSSVTIGNNIENIGRNAFSRHSEVLNIYTDANNIDYLKTFISEENSETYKTLIVSKETKED